MQADSLKKFQADFVQSAKFWGTFFGALRQNRQEVMGMKKIFACLLCVLLLAGCGGKQAAPAEPETAGEEAPAQEASGQETACVLETWDGALEDAYDGLSYRLTNNSGETATYGMDFSIEAWEDGQWQALPMAEDAAFTAEACQLEPGGTWTGTFGFSAFDCTVRSGTYRLVKQVGEERLTAEFRLSYSSDPEMGVPLDELPEDYGAAQAAEDGCVTFTWDGVENLDAMEVFLRKVERGIPCWIRVVQEYGEGWPLIADVFSADGESISWTQLLGDQWYCNIMAYLVTGGDGICISNAADWAHAEEHLGADLIWLVPEKVPGTEYAVSIVERMTERRLADGPVLQAARGENGWLAGRTADPEEFYIEDPAGNGAVHRLSEYDLPADFRLVNSVVWLGDTLAVYGNVHEWEHGTCMPRGSYDVETDTFVDVITPPLT